MEEILERMQEQIRLRNYANPYLEIYDEIKRISDRIGTVASASRLNESDEVLLHLRSLELLIRELRLLETQIHLAADILSRVHVSIKLFDSSREEGAP